MFCKQYFTAIMYIVVNSKIYPYQNNYFFKLFHFVKKITKNIAKGRKNAIIVSIINYLL